MVTFSVFSYILLSANLFQTEIIYHWCTMTILLLCICLTNTSLATSLHILWCYPSHNDWYILLCLSLPSLTSKIVSILILEHATLYYASSSTPTLNQALDWACSQYRASNTHDLVIEQFSASPLTYNILQLTEFILRNRLGWICSLAVICGCILYETCMMTHFLHALLC